MNQIVLCAVALIGVPLVLVAALLGAVAVAKVVFEPLERRNHYALAARIGIADVLCLLLVLKLTLALWWFAFRQVATSTTMALSMALIWTLFAAGWLDGVTSLSRAGIQSVWRRSLFLGLVVPATYVAATATFFGVVLGTISLLTRHTLPFVTTVVSGLVVLIVMFGLRAATAWVAVASPYAESSQPRLCGWPFFPTWKQWFGGLREVDVSCNGDAAPFRSGKRNETDGGRSSFNEENQNCD